MAPAKGTLPRMEGVDILVGCKQFCKGKRGVESRKLTKPSDDCIYCNREIAWDCREKCNEHGIDSD